MDISEPTITATSTPSSQTSSRSVERPSISSDFETFLQLLTAQLRNQDPLNPLESQDFAVQLATFSGVEQQVKTNDLIENLATSLGATGLSQLADWVGMEARVSAPVAFAGAPVILAPKAVSGADVAVLVVTDESGREVSREPLPPSAKEIVWVGTGTDGTPLPNGRYSLNLESYTGEELLSTDPVAHYAEVTEARLEGVSVELVLSGGTVAPASEVTGLRRPAS